MFLNMGSRACAARSLEKKEKGRIGDVMKTPFSYDLRTFRLCNPPARMLSSRMWPAIGKISILGIRNNLMSIPI